MVVCGVRAPNHQHYLPPEARQLNGPALETMLIERFQEKYPTQCSNAAADSRGLPRGKVVYLYVICKRSAHNYEDDIE